MSSEEDYQRLHDKVNKVEKTKQEIELELNTTLEAMVDISAELAAAGQGQTALKVHQEIVRLRELMEQTSLEVGVDVETRTEGEVNSSTDEGANNANSSLNFGSEAQGSMWGVLEL